ncbi:MBL fold metallo-hydrolase [Chloroflexota bacterium]
MHIHILGAHNSETKYTKFISFLIDKTLVIDAGGLTSSLSIEEQNKIKAILLTHKHYDHIRDIPSIAINLFHQVTSTNIYSTPDVYEALTQNILNGTLYPKFFIFPEANPALKYVPIEPNKTIQVEQYSVLPIKMNHNENTVGYQITSKNNKVMFYTSDTGLDLIQCWEHISPQLLLIEVTFPNRYRDIALETEHLTPDLLGKELNNFLKVKGYLPSVVATHMTPYVEDEIKAELAELAQNLNISIEMAFEGMQIQL